MSSPPSLSPTSLATQQFVGSAPSSVLGPRPGWTGKRHGHDDDALGCMIEIVTRVIYGYDCKEYGFYRPFQIDSAGCIRKIGPETKYTIQS